MTDSNTATVPDTSPEPVWLERAKTGDADAFGELCRLYEGRLLRQALALECRLSTAEDLVQETLVEAWKSLRRYNGTCRFYTWVCAILLNRHRKLLRATRRFWWIQGSPVTAEMERVPAGDPSPDQAVQIRDRARLLERCLASLPAKQREIIYLRFYADDSLEGIAAAVGCSVGTVKSRLFHAIEKLRRMKALRPPLEEPAPRPGAAPAACILSL